MCRLFGFRSAILSKVHTSLLSAENALVEQSRSHPDGWGLAYYVADAPHVVKSVDSAVDDHLFKRVSGIVSSQTVLAHLRKATTGSLNITNTHPFQFGKWVFAHNGNFKNFRNKESQLKNMIPDDLRRFILGHTDSELMFYLLLGKLGIEKALYPENCSYLDLKLAAQNTVSMLQKIIGPEHEKDDGPPDENYYSFIITNGSLMLAYNGGKSLYYSTYKTNCADKDRCSSYAPFCEAPSQDGFIRHLVVSSEPLGEPNVWLPLPQGCFIGVDKNMKARD